jgi:hypothetical protein
MYRHEGGTETAGLRYSADELAPAGCHCSFPLAVLRGF